MGSSVAVRRVAVPVLAAALATACNQQEENPFTNPNPSATPRPEASLVFASNLYAAAAGAPRDVYAAEQDGAGVARLSFCNAAGRVCDTLEAAPAPDRRRMALRRVARDANGDGRLTSDDGASILIVDLARGVEGELFPQSSRISGIDWSPQEDVLVYSAVGQGGVEDLFRTVPRPSPSESFNLTSSAGVRERRPRIDPSGTVAVYERIEEGGKGQIWVFAGRTAQVQVSAGAPGSEALPGTPYLVGSDADPDYSPDGRFVVFRRLTGTGNGGLGTWDVLTVRVDGSQLETVASGSVYRGPPDWGPQGIVFEEVDAAAATARLVVVQPDGGGRRDVVRAAGGVSLSFPRWLP